MQVNRDAERTTDLPIGQHHVFTVTVREFERQPSRRGEIRGKSAASGTSEGSRSEVRGFRNFELQVTPLSPVPRVSPEIPVRTRVFRSLLARIIHKGSSRKRADAKRDGHSEQGTGSAVCGGACPAPQTGTGDKKKGASPPQYVEGLNGETVRRSRVSALAAEAS